MAIDVSEIVAEFGAKYKAEGQNVNDLIAMIYQESETDQYFGPIPTDKTKLKKASANITSVFQAFQKQFTPKGDTSFKPRGFELNGIKIDVQEYPDDIEDNWLAFLANNNLSRKEWPFVKYWLQEMVLKQFVEDYEENEVYYGKYHEPTPGVANPDGKNFDGIRYKINKGVDNGDIIPIPSGSWTTNNPVTFVTEIQDWFKEIPEKLRKKIKELFMDPDLRNIYREGMREKYNKYYAQDSDLDIIKDQMAKIVGLTSMTGDQKIFCSIPMNMQIYIKKPENQRVFKIEELKRQVSAFTDFFKGFGIWIPEWVYTNDLNLGVPVVSSIAPAAGGTAGGTSVVITGRDFLFVDEDDPTAVRFGSTNATNFTVDSDTQITATTPALGAAAHDVNVKNEFGTGTLAGAFTAS